MSAITASRDGRLAERPSAALASASAKLADQSQATQKSLELCNEEKNARSRDEHEAADGRYTSRMLDIQTLSGVMTRKHGALSSAAEDDRAPRPCRRVIRGVTF